MDRLREELSCAICLEICFEPSTTPCGHSFCKKCLKSAADKCGKRCPKCRQLIGNGRSCTVNTILWNTIQLLFPQEVEARKANGATNCREEVKNRSPEVENYSGRTRSSARINSMVMNREVRVRSMRSRRSMPSQAEDAALSLRLQRGRSMPSQAEDAALAFRLQREEFMEAFRGTDEQVRTGASQISSARANLRAMASRAINLRIRGRPI
ncbi:zinc finger protein [Macleaya cordata]|uniref:RING-type E3 ubiquitin transferase n=1 Tax=Macleaya cordata TaxID=56857 RepID=A0A200R4G9_MACCD|nr:zinc finger protein [Macleaya cordata]